MFNLMSSPKLRGYGYWVLNVMRGGNIIALMTVAVSSWIMIVMSGLTQHFYFFDTTTHFFISTISLFLILSELQFSRFLKDYFTNNWPIFGPDHSFVWLGLSMIMLGNNMLSNINKPAFNIDTLGLPLWRTVLASGILTITFGVFNLVVSLLFRDGANNITARMIRRDGNLAAAKVDQADIYSYSTHSARPVSYRADDEDAGHANKLKRMTQRYTSAIFGRKNNGYDDGDVEKRPNISGPMPVIRDNNDDDALPARNSPIAPGVARPDSAMHPMRHHRLNDDVSIYDAQSTYRPASGMNRF
jgi:hypothetical protein